MSEIDTDPIPNKIQRLERRVAMLQCNQFLLFLLFIGYVLSKHLESAFIGGFLFLFLLLSGIVAVGGAIGYLLKNLFPGLRGM